MIVGSQSIYLTQVFSEWSFLLSDLFYQVSLIQTYEHVMGIIFLMLLQVSVSSSVIHLLCAQPHLPWFYLRVNVAWWLEAWTLGLPRFKSWLHHIAAWLWASCLTSCSSVSSSTEEGQYYLSHRDARKIMWIQHNELIFVSAQQTDCPTIQHLLKKTIATGEKGGYKEVMM